jgi:DNA-binding Lrp family transcriptional regulator
MKLDDKDRQIVTLVAIDPDISQEEIASQIGLSQPSVAMRVRKLKDAGALEKQIGISPFKMDLYVAKVDVSTNNTAKILDMFKGCPYFANGFTVSGRNNLSLFFLSEKISTLEAIVNNHIRSHDSVKDVDFNIVIGSEKDFVVPTVLTPELSELPPCGLKIRCKDCQSFHDKRCTGCPATGEYQGWFY